MRYVLFKRFRGMGLCGNVNLPYGTVCESEGEIITKDGNALVLATSENAHQYFARDDDGCGLERGRLTQAIQASLRAPANKKAQLIDKNGKPRGRGYGATRNCNNTRCANTPTTGCGITHFSTPISKRWNTFYRS